MYSLPLNHEPACQQAFDVDAVLYNVSDYMARAKLSRQASSASSTARGRCDRVSKPNSAGNSPQRRRAINAYRHSRYRTDFSSQEVPLQRRSMMNTNELQRPLQNTRPMSWHPSSQKSQYPSFSNHNAFGNARFSMTDQQSLAAEELTTPVMPPNIENSFVPTYIGLDDSYKYPSSVLGVYDEHPEGFNLDTTYDSCLGFSTNIKSQPMLYDDYQPPPPPPCATQAWTESLSEFPSHTNPPTPDFLPIQHPSDIWTEQVEEPVRPLPVRKHSMELVGMGLYDSPSNGFLESGMASLQQPGSGESQRESLGKGLKLEETWQPPEEDDASSENEEAESDVQSFSASRDVANYSAGPEALPSQTSLESYNQDYSIHPWCYSHQGQANPQTHMVSIARIMAPEFPGPSVGNYGWD